jgi:hypothetical protein
MLTEQAASQPSFVQDHDHGNSTCASDQIHRSLTSEADCADYVLLALPPPAGCAALQSDTELRCTSFQRREKKDDSCETTRRLSKMHKLSVPQWSRRLAEP